MSDATSPRTVLVLVIAVALDPLKVVTVTYSVSIVVLHVSVSQITCCKPKVSTAITQEEQLVLIERPEVIWLGDALIVPEGRLVLFVKEDFVEDGTEQIVSGFRMEESYPFTYWTEQPKLHE